MKKIKTTLERKPRHKKSRPQNHSGLKGLVGAFVCLSEIIITSSLWHLDQMIHLQLLLIVILIAIFIWILLLFSNSL